jgi:hypothetical protein
MTRRENHDSASFRFGGGIVLAVGLVPKTAISAAAQIADMADQVVAVKNVTAIRLGLFMAGRIKPEMTCEEIKQKIVELAREYVVTYDLEIIKRLYQLSLELEKDGEGTRRLTLGRCGSNGTALKRNA